MTAAEVDDLKESSQVGVAKSFFEVTFFYNFGLKT